MNGVVETVLFGFILDDSCTEHTTVLGRTGHIGCIVREGMHVHEWWFYSPALISEKGD